jgi:hypothetical protein
MPVLPLNSPRWRKLRSHFASVDGEPGEDASGLGDVPALLERWHGAVGTYGEEYAYANVFEAYLHQRTILNVAYAVVPHLASRLAELDADRRLEVLDDISFVEAVRLSPAEKVEEAIAQLRQTVPGELGEMMIQSMRDRSPSLPRDLAAAYFEGIATARRSALELVGAVKDEEAFRLLLTAISRLHGQDLLATILDELDQDELSEHLKEWSANRRQSPRHWRRHLAFLKAAGWRATDVEFGVKALTAKKRGGALLSQSLEEALAGLRNVQPKEAPSGWFKRTRIGEPEGELAFRALHSLAWVNLKVPLKTILREAGLKG